MFSLPDLAYPYNALEPYIDERTMQIHHDKHHGTYVNNLNKALETYQDKGNKFQEVGELIKNLDQVPEEKRTAVRNNGGGHFNHSLFWEVLAPNANGEERAPSGKLASAIEDTFGDVSTFKEKFSTTGLGRFGSGWVWLVVNRGKLEVMDTPNQDNPIMDGKGIPILGLDVWEHAYYLKYQNLRGDYIKNWWNVVNWGEVERRFEKV